MRRFAVTALVLSIFCSVTSVGCRADDMPLLGVSTASGPSAPTYQGPGDIVSGAIAWWGLRAYNAAYAASLGPAINVCLPLDVTCEDIDVTASGGLNLSTITALGCNNLSSICTIKIFYDQSGGNNCSSGACNLEQTTVADRYTLTLNCIGTLPCATATAGESYSTSGSLGTISQPNTWSFAAEFTGTFNGAYTLVESNFGTQQEGLGESTANDGFCYAGTVLLFPAVGNAFHAVQCILNGNSSIAYVDGTATNGAAGSGVAGGNPINLSSSNTFVGNMLEGGLWAIGFSSAQQSAMNANQTGYWGF